MLAYRIAADLVVTFHFGYIAFVGLGLLATWHGLALGPGWARNRWFRAARTRSRGTCSSSPTAAATGSRSCIGTGTATPSG